MIIIEDDDGCFLTMKRRLDSKKESQHQVCYSLFLEASLTDHYESSTWEVDDCEQHESLWKRDKVCI